MSVLQLCKLFFNPHIHAFCSVFPRDIVHYRCHLDTDAFHHVQLPSAVQVQNGLKLAGGPAVSIIVIIIMGTCPDKDDDEFVKNWSKHQRLTDQRRTLSRQECIYHRSPTWQWACNNKKLCWNFKSENCKICWNFLKPWAIMEAAKPGLRELAKGVPQDLIMIFIIATGPDHDFHNCQTTLATIMIIVNLTLRCGQQLPQDLIMIFIIATGPWQQLWSLWIRLYDVDSSCHKAWLSHYGW